MIQAYTNQYLDNIAGSKSFDYVQDFGAWLPPMVIGALVGVPESDRDMYRRWTDESLHIDEGQTGPSEKAQKARMEGGAYVWNMVQERRKNLGDDMISDLLQAEIDQDGEKRKLTDLEVVAFVQLLAGAGSETVARFLGFAGVELGRNPDQRKILVEDPSVIPNAVEELLRYEAPSPVNGRWVMHDTEIHGTKIPKDSKILLINGSANRDPREYDEPEKLKVKREIKRHITFGYGPHFCLGASLARLEAKVALAETLKRYPNWEVDEAGLEMVRTTTVRGYAKVPITV
jgi:cytochrome P450